MSSPPSRCPTRATRAARKSARSIEHTAEEKIETQLFDGDQAGLDKAVAWLHERYTAEADRWTDIPSILDCEPDR